MILIFLNFLDQLLRFWFLYLYSAFIRILLPAYLIPDGGLNWFIFSSEVCFTCPFRSLTVDGRNNYPVMNGWSSWRVFRLNFQLAHGGFKFIVKDIRWCLWALGSIYRHCRVTFEIRTLHWLFLLFLIAVLIGLVRFRLLPGYRWLIGIWLRFKIQFTHY